jgi:hypothetical protein
VLEIHFVAQQVLCNALGASGLHWVWAIDAASGSRLFFWTSESRSRHVERSGEIPMYGVAGAIGAGSALAPFLDQGGDGS